MSYKRCKICKKRINTDDDIFCSTECEIIFNKLPVKLCINCNMELDRMSNRKFCSLSCANEYQKKINLVERMCIYCNKTFIVNKSSRKIKLCSDDCQKQYSRSKIRNDRRLKTLKKNNMEKYGTEWYFNTNKYKAKYKNTMITKYGVDNPMKCPEIQQRSEQTNIKKYGVKNPIQNTEIKDKMRNSMMEKYGVQYALQNDVCNMKMKQTNLLRYGKEYSFGSDEIRNKIKNTVKMKYGVDNISQDSIISDKIKKTMYKKTYNIITEKYKDYVIPLFTIDEYQGGGYNNLYKFRCVKCNAEFEHWIYSGIIPRCEQCYPKHTNTSIGEKEIVNYIQEIISDKNINENDKTQINPLELDIYLPDKNLAIEFNGIKWHSEVFGGKDKTYHLNKTNKCEANGIKLLHIFESEWIYKQDVIKSIIKSNLNIYDRTIYARKCEIREVFSKEKDEFLNENHLQGKDISSIRLGLYYENELVSIMTFSKSRFNKNVQYEMTRFCNKLNVKVIGGASKLFNHFIKNNSPESIISYADKRFFTGELYYKLGFKFIEDTTPNYFYFEDKNYLILHNRIKFQKHKLLTLLEKYDISLSEWENMQNNGYDRIFDCGNKKFIWKK